MHDLNADDARALEAQMLQVLLAHRRGELDGEAVAACRAALETAWVAGASPLADVVRAIDLRIAEALALLVIAGAALDDRVAREIAELQLDIAAHGPTAGFVIDLVAPAVGREVSPELFDDDMLLVSAALVTLAPHPDQPRSRRRAICDLDPAILARLEGSQRLPAELRCAASFATAVSPWLRRDEAVESRIERIARVLTVTERTTVVISGPRGSGKTRAAIRFASELDRELLTVRLEKVADPQRALTLAAREARLRGALLAVSVHGVQDAAALASRVAWARELCGVVFVIVGDRQVGRAIAGGDALECEVPALEPDEQPAFLGAALARAGVSASETAIAEVRAAGLTPGALDRIAARVAAAVRMRESEPSHAQAVELANAVREHLRGLLSGVAELVDARATWDDLVLPAGVLERLREVAGNVQHRTHVLDSWGFADKAGPARGTSVLFAGPPGTGKTMAASVIAGALGIDLYRVDLSQIVSKYVGDTEKNLARVFDAAGDGNAVLLFDEADSLFAKRTEVKSSTDRYANLEVNYLLQRLETFPGVVILTTNFLRNIDDAFRRRLRFIIELPFPEVDERERIWRSMLPSRAEIRGDVPWRALAELDLSGGHIRNAMLRAAFAAAARRDALLPFDLVRSAIVEVEAVGRLPPDMSAVLARLERPPGAVERGPVEAPEHECDEPVPARAPEPEPVSVEVPTLPAVIERKGMRPLITNFPFPRRA